MEGHLDSNWIQENRIQPYPMGHLEITVGPLCVYMQMILLFYLDSSNHLVDSIVDIQEVGSFLCDYNVIRRTMVVIFIILYQTHLVHGG